MESAATRQGATHVQPGRPDPQGHGIHGLIQRIAQGDSYQFQIQQSCPGAYGYSR
ncbi:hypothetical protein ACMGG8_14250 [Pseudomonas sp. BNK-45]|uniref:hypothetical protein n=1 Tax=Pseudomonas sp. BNK-45 TaxID=3376180 RepID=UPI0039BED9E4